MGVGVLIFPTKKKNYKIPKKINAEELTLEECRKIIDSAPEPKTKKHPQKELI